MCFEVPVYVDVGTCATIQEQKFAQYNHLNDTMIYSNEFAINESETCFYFAHILNVYIYESLEMKVEIILKGKKSTY